MKPAGAKEALESFQNLGSQGLRFGKFLFTFTWLFRKVKLTRKAVLRMTALAELLSAREKINDQLGGD